MSRFFRVFKFSVEVLSLIRTNPALLNPIFFNIAFTVPVSMVLAYGGLLVETRTQANILMGTGLTLLYFMDYFCNGMTCSMIYDQVTGGHATVSQALRRTAQSAPGIFVFAAVSGLLDLLTTAAQQAPSQYRRVLAEIIYRVWTTAVYVVMPAMVVERLSFGESFARSKTLMREDPTQVGLGVIALSVVNWALGIGTAYVAYRGAPVVATVHPLLGGIFFYTFFNMYWALAGFVKITYFTCFYLWARSCEQERSADPALAPAPLANALAA